MTRMTRQFLLLLLLQMLIVVCHGIQQFEETPQYTEVNPGQDAKLVCLVLGKRGQCIWQKDQKPIGMHLKKYEWVGAPDTGDCSLWIRLATLEFDDGLWQCQVTASDFTTQDALTSEPARLVVRVSPQRPQIEYADRLILPGSNVTARAGEIATLTCRARYGNPSPLIKWYVGETELRMLRPQVNLTEADNPRTWATYSICDILAERSRYGQSIRCVAIHPTYPNPTMSSSTEVRFDVRYAPETRLVGVPTGQLEEGRDQLEIRCLADANPPASIVWRKTKSPGVTEVASIGETLMFSPIYRNHAAVYLCEASNTEGESSPISVQVSVNYPPTISAVGPDRLTTALLYSGASFECHADAMPPAEYRWAQIFTDGRKPLECGTGQRLILTNVTYEQQGQYICLASNKINGNVREVKSDPVSLQVVGAPRVVKPAITEKFVVVTTEGSPARLEIRLCSDPKPRLVAWEWGSTRLHAGEVLESRYRALDLEPLASEDCYVAILELTSTVKEDQRLYHVIVENERGSDRRALMLKVNEPGQIPLVIGAVAGFTVLSVLIMGFVCFLRSDRCCVARNTVPALQQVHCTKASNAMIEDPRLAVDTMERTSQQFVPEKRANHVLKPVPSQQYQQECYQHEPQHQQQHHYQRHHHHGQPHGQYTLQDEERDTLNRIKKGKERGAQTFHLFSRKDLEGGAAVSQTRSLSDVETALQEKREAATIYDIQAELAQLKILLRLFCIDIHG
ncbi:kin of IRRE-like protein 2 isoform X2 [Ooceraea biroi]|uniref:kin of IRRE-like protein 2 isoform X2 n=1 Tax=Ooceraea biroi TaxID=2015173 RepID=UPI0005B983D6|nr:kin of IRRE-like protein 2 isoform X2 [Ooceraea biroi]